MKKLEEYINIFLENKMDTTDIYNEFSLQHELGIFLRNILPSNFKVEFERNAVSFFGMDKENIVKKEIDISVFNEDKTEKYAIELKFLQNGQYPESMYACVKDIKFMEQLKNHGFTNTFCLTIALEEGFYTSGAKKDGIYNYFREENRVYGKIDKPTGEKKEEDFIELEKDYPIEWLDIILNDSEKKGKFYVIQI